MSEGDRPAEATTSRVIPLRARVRPRRSGVLLSAGEVARRLAALERQVENALGTERIGRGSARLEAVVDDVLGAWVAGRAWLAEHAAGLSSSALGDASVAVLRRWWWRIDVVGRERMPAGPALLIANRGSALLPYEALMAGLTLGAECGPRYVRPFVDEWLADLPLVGAALRRLGAERIGPARVRRTLASGDTALVFPEGRDAVARPYAQAYRVSRFARTSILRVALETGVPIVPIGLIGVDEVHPVLARLALPRIASVLGIPALPVTPTLLPLPTKWTVFVGEPFDTAVRCAPNDLRDAAMVRALMTTLRERLQGVVSDGLRRRRSIFFR